MELQFLDGEFRMIKFAGDDGFEVGFSWQRPKAEHFKKFAAIFIFLCIPVGQSVNIAQAIFRKFCCFRFEIVAKHFVAARREKDLRNRRCLRSECTNQTEQNAREKSHADENRRIDGEL